jgi:hypothetical protein
MPPSSLEKQSQRTFHISKLQTFSCKYLHFTPQKPIPPVFAYPLELLVQVIWQYDREIECLVKSHLCNEIFLAFKEILLPGSWSSLAMIVPMQREDAVRLRRLQYKNPVIKFSLIVAYHLQYPNVPILRETYIGN